MSDLHIEVTWGDIEHGQPESPATCPVALALWRAGVTAPLVTEDEVCGTYRGQRFRVAAPDDVSRFVGQVDGFADADGTPSPFAFDLTGPAFGE